MLKNKNFKILEKRKILDIDSEYYEFLYKPLGTKIIWIKNKDQERHFNIGFKTPPIDDSGINHIIEHSVLRGSRKYPFEKEEVFAELLKKSAYTYLNASTYPDKTIYPFSTTLESEFYKILDIYLDAVFFPKLLENKKIFQQEGWRYDLNDKNEIIFNGVVFNEMKGAYSNDWRIHWAEMKKNLFKNTIYKFESGGNPSKIIKLKYEKLIEYYKKHYHPSNALIVFYGDLKIEKILDYLEKEFFNHFKKKKEKIKTEEQKDFKKEIKKTTKFPSTNDKNIFSISFLFKNKRDLNYPLGILGNILFRENSSKLTKKILESGLAEKVEYDVNFHHFIHPMMSIIFKGVKKKNFNKLEKLFWTTLEEILEKGFSKEELENYLNIYEYRLKTKKLETGLGIQYSENLIASWTIGKDKKLYRILEFEKGFEKNKNKITNPNYLKKIAKKYFLENQNRLTLRLVADKNLDPEKEIKKELKKINSRKNKEKIYQEIKEFKEWEKIQEPEENLKLIKNLELKNFPKKIEEYKYEVENNNYIFAKGKDKDLEFFILSFDISHLKIDELQRLNFILNMKRLK